MLTDLLDTALVYDLEIIKAIPGKREPLITGIEYAAGWHDHANMGISVIGAYDFKERRSRVFLADNFADFEALCRERWPLVSFNGLSFDNLVLKETLMWGAGELAWFEERCYDMLAEIAKATGTFAGYGLDACCKATLGPGAAKSGSGAMAPVLWQQGRYGEVADYCIMDTVLTARLYEHIVEHGCITNPREYGPVQLALPNRPVHA